MFVNSGGGGTSHQIAKSLRFRSSASAFLSRTPAGAGNRRTWTWSGWVKRGAFGVDQRSLFASSQTSPLNGSNCQWFGFNASDQLETYMSVLGSTTTSQVFRDPAAHYHIVLAFDTTQAINTDRYKLYVNGQRITSFSSYATFVQNTDYYVNIAQAHGVGANVYSPNDRFFDGLLSEINFIDGQALGPENFGEFNENGVWIPKKYAGTYGTNGFYLPFSDGSNLTNLCLDRSGNGNNWTATNVSLTAGATYDWMDDTPTNNFSSIISTDAIGSTITEAGLKVSAAGTSASARASFRVSSGKWYWEGTYISGANSNAMFGVCDSNVSIASSSWTGVSGWCYNGFNGNKYTNGASAAYGATYTANDVIGVALDMDAGTVTFYKNGVSQGVAYSTLSGKTISPTLGDPGDGPHVFVYNFGQAALSSGASFYSAAGGWFKYAPPTGFKALCTKNLPVPVIANPKKHFEAVTWTSTGTTQSITGAQFQPDMLWSKQRNGTAGNVINNSVIGASQYLTTYSTGAETTATTFVTSFDSGGMTFGTGQYTGGAAVVGWLWKANGAPVANNAGSIQSQVSANTTAGFSIVTYTGTGANATVGHGLGVAPKMVIVKNRGGATNWPVIVSGLGSNYLLLNSTAAQTANSDMFSSYPNSTVFYPSTNAAINTNGNSHVAYCFAEVPGFSRISSYVGNGSSDGPFVWCGFRPRWVMIKRTDDISSWVIFDTARSQSNVATLTLYPNKSIAEYTGSPGGTSIDIVCNGIKIRGTDSDFNANGASYIFMAFAEAPFNYANAR